MRLDALTGFGAGLLLAIAASAAAEPDPKLKALGAHLSRECTSCHRLDGVDNGIPSIIGLEAEYFVETLRFYRDGLRPNPAMKSVADSLDDQQMQALAAYFGGLSKTSPQTASQPKGKK